MSKRFNVTGICLPEQHYMVDISDRLEEIKMSVDGGEYFTINKARQYGKTTTLWNLKSSLAGEYCVCLISFEGMTKDAFVNEKSFCKRFYGLLSQVFKYEKMNGITSQIREECNHLKSWDSDENHLQRLSDFISEMCVNADRPLVLMIDEVDQASNYEVFIGFLGMLRDKYLKRMAYPTFQSVILAGVHDIKNLKSRIRSDETHQYNSPWNIAADFQVDMNLSEKGIAGMLRDYDNDFHTGMETKELSALIYEYTSGYPYLVSRICKLIDERIAGSKEYPDRQSAWTKSGFLASVRMMLTEENTLFESLDNKLLDYPELKEMLQDLLFQGKTIEYIPGDMGIRVAAMFGFVVIIDGIVKVANRIFETRLYNGFLAEKARYSKVTQIAADEKNQFITDGKLDMDLVVKKFVMHYTELFGMHNEKFLEDDGRSIFLLYMKPIINGSGNYYIEAKTRNNRRTDLVIDYLGQQFIVELKVWHGDEYNRRGEKQLADYLETYHASRGYLISFNFNQKKEVGVKQMKIGDKILIEAIV